MAIFRLADFAYLLDFVGFVDFVDPDIRRTDLTNNFTFSS